MKFALLLCAAVTGYAHPAVEHPVNAAPLTAITNVTVIDVRNGNRIPGQTVLLASGRISDVGPASTARVPSNARVVDGTGRFIIPGLWDMQTHLRTRTAPTIELPLFLANGVTGIRETGSDCEDATAVDAACIGDFRRWQQEIDSGALVGARLLTLSSGRMVDDYDPPICNSLFAKFARNDTWYVPTHVTRLVEANAAELVGRKDPADRYVPQSEHAAWVEDRQRTDAAESSPAGRCARRDFYERGLAITGDAYRAGVRILAGTGAGDSFIYPGLSLHDELIELVRAGLPPAAALRAATLSGAEYLGKQRDYGSVERGKVGDLVLLTADPLVDIRNTARIQGVFLGGRYFDRLALDELLRGVAAAAAKDSVDAPPR
jgi:hypothetical protein